MERSVGCRDWIQNRQQTPLSRAPMSGGGEPVRRASSEDGTAQVDARHRLPNVFSQNGIEDRERAVGCCFGRDASLARLPTPRDIVGAARFNRSCLWHRCFHLCGPRRPDLPRISGWACDRSVRRANERSDRTTSRAISFRGQAAPELSSADCARAPERWQGDSRRPSRHQSSPRWRVGRAASTTRPSEGW